MLCNSRTYRQLITVTVGVLLMMALSGCRQVEPNAVHPYVELPTAFSTSGSQPLTEQWWRSFNDPRLDEIIEQALSDNFTIRSAWDRLTQAEQIAVKTGASLYPSVNYRAGDSYTRRQTEGVTTSNSAFSAGLSASYELDLWGQIKSVRQAALLDAAAAQENVNAAAITLSAVIAKTWYQLAEAKQKSRVILNQYETNKQVLELITLQFRQGQVTAADVFRQQQLVESSRGQHIKSEEAIELLQHQLSVLIGKTPDTWWADESIDLVSLGQMPTVDIPAVVIQRRPDVLANYKTVQAADSRFAAAIADQYPSISLSASVETSAEKVSDLFDDWFTNLAANLTGPLLDAGLRKAEVQRTKAVLSQVMNDYSQSVLEALQEVEDAISQESYQRQYVKNLQSQLSLAQQVNDRIRQNYVKGQVDYIRVLESLVSLQSLEQTELTARRVLIENRIDLCRAIAGSWELSRPAEAVLDSE